MIQQEILAMLIESGRVSIIPVGFEEEGEGESDREGAKCDECGCEHDKENDLMTIKGDIK